MEVTLEPLATAHLDVLYSIKNNEAVLNDIPGDYPLDREVFDATNGKIIAAGPSVKQAAFTIYVDGIIAGMTGHFSRENSSDIEVGYFIGEQWWSKGVVTKAMQLNLKNMRQLGVSGKVIGCHAAENVASGRVLEKSGFSRDGEKAFTMPNGEIVTDPQWIILL